MLARGDSAVNVLVVGDRSHQQADHQDALRFAGSLDHLTAIVDRKRERRLAEYMLALAQGGDDELPVIHARNAHVDRIDGRVADKLHRIASRPGAASLGHCGSAIAVAAENTCHFDSGYLAIATGMLRTHRATAKDP